MLGTVGLPVGFVKDPKRFLNSRGSKNRILTVSDLAHGCVERTELQHDSMAVQGMK